MINPAANFQPYSAQYTPIDANIESSVLILVNPSSSSLPLVAISSSTVLNLNSIAPMTPNAPSPFFAVPPASGLGGGGAEIRVASAAIVWRMVANWTESGGSSGSASSQASRAPGRSPAAVAARALADRASS